MATAKQEKADKPQKKKKKLSGKKIAAGIVLALFSFILYIGLQPVTGTINFGICRVFAERNLVYPSTMRVVGVQERPQDVRLDVASLNQFGESMVTQVACNFHTDAAKLHRLSSATINRRKVPDREVEIFNTIIPYILANPPSLALPAPIPDNLADLQR
jgi:hypothetical protein